MAAKSLSVTPAPDPTSKGRTHDMQYGTYKVDAGQNITVEVRQGGVLVGTLGPWTASATKDRDAIVQVRMRVETAADLRVPEEPELGEGI